MCSFGTVKNDYRIFFNRIVMRNFLRIRNGDRFWYERSLSDEVNKWRLYQYYHVQVTIVFTIKIKFIFKCRRFEADTYKELIRLVNTAVSTNLTKKTSTDKQVQFHLTLKPGCSTQVVETSVIKVLFRTTLTWTITHYEPF